MASYKAVQGVLYALRDFLKLRMQDDLDKVLESPSVSILGTVDLRKPPTESNGDNALKLNSIGIYLHRVSVDPFGRNRYLQSRLPNTAPQPELAINLHLFLLAWTTHGESEAVLTTWAMQQLGSALELGYSHLHSYDASWSVEDVIQIQPEEMSTEDLLRIWDSLPGNYILSVPYIVKTLRLLPVPEAENGMPVTSVITPFFTRGDLPHGR